MARNYSDQQVVEVANRNWTPAQILALVLGVLFIVLGGVALLRTGIGDSVFEPSTSVAGLAYTPLLGIIEVSFGLILLAIGAYPRATEGVVFLGVLALAFGLLLVIEPTAFQQSLAAGRAHGWFYVVVGGLAAAVGLATPTVISRRTVHRQAPATEQRRPIGGNGHGSSADHSRTQRLEPSDRGRA